MYKRHFHSLLPAAEPASQQQRWAPQQTVMAWSENGQMQQICLVLQPLFRKAGSTSCKLYCHESFSWNGREDKKQEQKCSESWAVVDWKETVDVKQRKE